VEAGEEGPHAGFPHHVLNKHAVVGCVEAGKEGPHAGVPQLCPAAV
jgi:hypothetical protein